MLNTNELRKIQSVNEYPSVSILLPTHKQFPQNQQDPIRLKNLINKATTRLTGEFSKSDIKPLLKNLDDVVSAIDFQHTMDGLAIFVNKHDKFSFILPFPVKERVTVDKDFATRDLVFAINRSQPYWVLILSDKSTRLFYAVRNSLSEVNNGGFPFLNKLYEIKSLSFEGHFKDGIDRNVEREKKYLREADSHLKALNSQSYFPIVLVGVERSISMFGQVSSQSELIISSVKGSYENHSSRELQEIVWPEAKKGFKAWREEALETLEKAIGKKRFVSGMDECWKVANEGRGSLLLVEVNFHYPARLGSDGIQLIESKVESGPDVLDDAVDEIIETVITKGGRVVFVENGSLKTYGKIAMVLRY